MLKELLYKAARVLTAFTKSSVYKIQFGQYNKDYFETYKPNVDPVVIDRIHKQFLKDYKPQITLFKEKIQSRFKVVIKESFFHTLAAKVQIFPKAGPTNYVHGLLLYGAIKEYVRTHPQVQYTIFETGTSKGFSSLCMAKALADSNVAGRVVTTDILPVHKPIRWCCAADGKGKQNRLSLLSDYKDLLGYVIFLQGYTDILTKQVLLPRIHAAFIDAEHTFKPVLLELTYVSHFQEVDDIIVCDDYNIELYPGVVKAVDQFAKRRKYKKEVFGSAIDTRKYVLLTKQ
ncbi:MAG: hypothetical protein ACI8Y7_000370 [Candidatus Woesearchaeota archaeon]|jgi:hypothetical protein